MIQAFFGFCVANWELLKVYLALGIYVLLFLSYIYLAISSLKRKSWKYLAGSFLINTVIVLITLPLGLLIGKNALAKQKPKQGDYIVSGINPDNSTYSGKAKITKKEAEGMGGYLVCITDQAEDEFVLQLIRDANNGEVPHIWIGLTDEANEGDLKWVNGDKTVYWRNSPSKFLPSDIGEEDFVHYYAAPSGAKEVNWNDNIGSQEFSYIIEYDQERPDVVGRNLHSSTNQR